LPPYYSSCMFSLPFPHFLGWYSRSEAPLYSFRRRKLPPFSPFPMRLVHCQFHLRYSFVSVIDRGSSPSRQSSRHLHSLFLSFRFPLITRVCNFPAVSYDRVRPFPLVFKTSASRARRAVPNTLLRPVTMLQSPSVFGVNIFLDRYGCCRSLSQLECEATPFCCCR